MRKKSFYVWSLMAALIMTACSDQNEDVVSGVTGGIDITVGFEGAVADGTRAVSTAIPPTSWANIEQVQIFLYDASDNVVISAVETPNAAGALPTIANIPTGNYTVVAVANAKSSAKNKIATYLDGGTTPTAWDMWNVRQKNLSELVLKQEALAGFPDYATPPTLVSPKAFAEAGEIFMAAADVTVSAPPAATATASLKLKREVSLMRCRVDVDPINEQGIRSGQNLDVDFTQKASITIYRLPVDMKIGKDAKGGASTTIVNSNAISISGAGVFNTVETPYSAGSIFTNSDNFSMWRDVIVFPNSGSRAESVAGTIAETDKYFIAISAWANADHVYADGTKAPVGGAMVYWDGPIDGKFAPNMIRDVNLLLRTGGKKTMPEPNLRGSLTVTLETPADWSSNILTTDVPM